MQPIDRRQVTDIVAADLLKIIDQHPAAFDVLLFKADLQRVEQVTDTLDVVGTIESSENKFFYQRPMQTKAVELPRDLSGLQMLASGTGALDASDEPVVLLLKEKNVPEQSVVWIEEQLSDDETKVTLLYILHSAPIGKHGQGGAKHFLIPFNGVLSQNPVDEDIHTPTTVEPLPESEPESVGVISDLSDFLGNE